MQPYYAQPAMPPSVDPRMQQMQQMQQMQNGGMAMGGMGMMGPGGMMGPSSGMGMMGSGGGGMMNPMAANQIGMMSHGYNAWMPQQLGYDYQLPSLGYKPQPTWGAWDLATAQYNGGRLDRGFFDQLIGSLSDFFNARHLSEEAARDAHRRVYYRHEGQDAGNKTLGGAAAYQAFLWWDRDHHSAYHTYPTNENRERLVGLAVAELYSLWERVEPRSTRARLEEAAEYAAATAKHLFDRHYDTGGAAWGRRGYSGYAAEDEHSDSGSMGRRERRRSFYNGGGTPGPMMMQGAGYPQFMGPGMTAGMGMNQPGYGALGMPGAIANPIGYGGVPGMGGMVPMMGGGMGMGINGLPANGGVPLPEAPALPGMHPYTFGRQSGVMYGNQPIDQAGHATFIGGPERSWYAWGPQRWPY